MENMVSLYDLFCLFCFVGIDREEQEVGEPGHRDDPLQPKNVQQRILPMDKVILYIFIFEVQCGLKYRPLGYRKHLTTKCLEVLISNGSVLEWLVIATGIAMVPTLPKPNNWKSEQNAGHFFKTEHLENQKPLEN